MTNLEFKILSILHRVDNPNRKFSYRFTIHFCDHHKFENYIQTLNAAKKLVKKRLLLDMKDLNVYKISDLGINEYEKEIRNKKLKILIKRI